MAFDPKSTAQLKTINERLSRWLNNTQILTNKANKLKFLKDLKDLETEAEALINNLSEDLDEPRDAVGFAEFLSDIGDSVVETQRKLDEQSRVYLEEIRPSKHITPAIYRIPKVSASIKFGMRKTKKAGFNIIVAQSSQEDERMMNQSLEFEILSVPPPPDFHQALSGEIPSIGFVFSPPVRQAIFADLKRYTPKPEQTGLNKDLLIAVQNEVLILHIGPRMKTGFDDYLLLYADEEADKNVGIWSLLRDPSGQRKPVFEIILKFSASDRKGENYKILRDIILTHSQQQLKLLGE